MHIECQLFELKFHKTMTLFEITSNYFILDKPVFEQDLPRTIEMIEGRKALVNMTSKANPERVIYQWIKDTDNGPRQIRNFGSTNANDIDGDNSMFNKVHERIFTTDGVLNITKVLRSDAGFYTIKAKNDEGASQTKISMDVLYEPR